MNCKSAEISAISFYLPDEIINNQQLVDEFGTWKPEKIFHKTGINERRVAKKELVSDMAVAAAENLFEEYDLDRKEVDFLILCTETPDFIMPATACIVHDRLGLSKHTGAFDYNLGCSGYIYGLAMAKSMVVSGIASKVLLVTGDVLTKFINPMDKSTRTIFGDAATATMVEESNNINGIGEFVFGTDGGGAKNLTIPAGGMALPRSPETAKERRNRFGNVRSENDFYMNGPEILKFSMDEVPLAVSEVLEKNCLDKASADLFIFHQATKLVLEHLRDNLEIPENKFYMNMENLGNTVSSTIPLALKQAQKEKRIYNGDRVVLAGFGVGYSWG